MPPEPPPDDADEGRVLDPDELDITGDDRVAEIDENRYVVSPGSDRPDVVADEDPHDDADLIPPSDDDEREDETIDATAVADWLAESLADADGDYAFDATLATGGDVERRRLVTDDVVTSFETLVLWYARQVGGDTPVEETLGLLLAESNVPIRYPPQTVRGLLRRYDLSQSDSVADLLAAIDDDDGLTLSSL